MTEPVAFEMVQPYCQECGRPLERPEPMIGNTPIYVRPQWYVGIALLVKCACGVTSRAMFAREQAVGQ